MPFPGATQVPTRVTFTIGADGTADRLTYEEFGIFTRVQEQAQTGTHVTEDHVRAALPALETYMQDAQAKTGVPGVSVAVVLQNKVLYLKGFGVRSIGKSEPVTEDTVFQLASLSKPIGSTVIASLVSDGIVSWDAKISDLDPAFQLHDAYPTSQLTVRDLYSHRSGLPGDAGNDLEEVGYGRDEILHRVRYLLPASSFRSTFAYSNFGMTAGGAAAVKPTGKSWEEVSKEKLYTPLAMTHTSSLNADFLKETNVAKLHIKVDGQWTAKLIRQPDAQSPAGGVSSTAKDLAQWLKLHIANGKFAGTPLIKEAAMLETHWNRDVFLSYSTPEVPDWPSPVTFTIGPDGKASQMFIDALNTNGQGVLTRAQ
jgi:CubicO group peptidase (beta-lactamase class C family)